MEFVGYIPVKKHLIEMYTQQPVCNFCTIVKKYPIKNIKIDKKYFNYQNVVSDDEVHYMLLNFDKDAWEPIMLNENGYLLDGQHRLKLAGKLGLNFIDVVIRKN